MGWGYRRSKNFGGFRINFSKSGISTSYGVKGFRLSNTLHGTYITASAGGFYYRHRLSSSGKKRRPSSIANRQNPDSSTGIDYKNIITNVPLESLSDFEQKDLIDALNDVLHSGCLQIIYVITSACLLLLFFNFKNFEEYTALYLILAGIGYFYVRGVEQKRRRYLLIYDLSDDQLSAYKALSEGIILLSKSRHLSYLKTQANVLDRKRNAGAASIVDFARASVYRSKAPNIISNIIPARLRVGFTSIYFFPDKIMFYNNRRYAAISYHTLKITDHGQRFIWEQLVPRDAEIVDYTWRFVNKNGSPDRRFNNNRKIPILYLQQMHLESDTVLNVVLQASNHELSRFFIQSISKYQKKSIEEHQQKKDRKNKTIPDNLLVALRVFGLTTFPDREELKNLYHSMAFRNHPDRFENSPEMAAFATERMQEINSAYRILCNKTPKESSDNSSDNHPIVLENKKAKHQIINAFFTIPWREVFYLTLVLIVIFIYFRGFPSTLFSESTSKYAHTSVTEESKGLKVNSNCNLRAMPKKISQKIALLKAGTMVFTVSHDNTWVEVKTTEGLRGWIINDCLSHP